MVVHRDSQAIGSHSYPRRVAVYSGRFVCCGTFRGKDLETKIVIPTYLAGDPDPNPMFFFGRESQGSLGPVYPYPMYDSLTGKKADKALYHCLS